MYQILAAECGTVALNIPFYRKDLRFQGYEKST